MREIFLLYVGADVTDDTQGCSGVHLCAHIALARSVEESFKSFQIVSQYDDWRKISRSFDPIGSFTSFRHAEAAAQRSFVVCPFLKILSYSKCPFLSLYSEALRASSNPMKFSFADRLSFELHGHVKPRPSLPNSLL